MNDTYGHEAGDQVLKGVADRLRSAVRDEDLTARLGGDEFAILQYGPDNHISAPALAARINECISAPMPIESREFIIGASVGMRLSSELENDPKVLLHQADQALYRVKRAGRGGFALSS